jgi:hypothetical protein
MPFLPILKTHSSLNPSVILTCIFYVKSRAFALTLVNIM